MICFIRHTKKGLKFNEVNKLRKRVIKKNNKANMNQKMMELMNVDKNFESSVLEKLKTCLNEL